MTKHSIASHLSKGNNDVVYKCHDVLSDSGVVKERRLPMARFQYCFTHQLGTLNDHTLTDVGLTEIRNGGVSWWVSKWYYYVYLWYCLNKHFLVYIAHIYSEKA